MTQKMFNKAISRSNAPFGNRSNDSKKTIIRCITKLLGGNDFVYFKEGYGPTLVFLKC
jgi:hypothetical protein